MAIIDLTANADSLIATSANDVIRALGGNDTVYGMSGEDTFYGGTGDDSLYGGNDFDSMHGGAGNDLILCGNGARNFIHGEVGDDTLTGGNGNDIIYGGIGNDRIRGEEGNNRLFGGTGDDNISLGTFMYGSGTADGGDGNDGIQVNGLFNSTVEGGNGTDVLSLFFASIGTAVDANIDFSQASPIQASSGTGTIVHSGFERFSTFLGDGNDTVIGGSMEDSLWVAGGANIVDAGAGNDSVLYKVGAANTLEGGLGQDTLIASDAYYFIVDTGDGSVDDGQLSVLTGFEAFDIRTTNSHAILSLAGGNDLVYAGFGNDTAFGMGGNDRITTSRGADLVFGGTGDDWMIAGHGADSLDGGDGNDTLAGGRGKDTLTGGSGADRFIFLTTGDDPDCVVDFTSGEDCLRIRAAALGVPAVQTGLLDANALRDGAAVGTGAQFVTVFDQNTDQTGLYWYDQGINSPAAQHLLTFSGEVTLRGGDVILI